MYCPLSLARTISVTTQWQGGDVNLYEGLRCHGVPLVTISRGRVVYENGIFTCAEGSGKFYPLRTFPDFLYKKMVQRDKVRHHQCPSVHWGFIHLLRVISVRKTERMLHCVTSQRVVDVRILKLLFVVIYNRKYMVYASLNI